MSLLSEQTDFTVTDSEGVDETRIFEISIDTSKDLEETAEELKYYLVKFMDEELPENYLFDFTSRRLGFINSFYVFSEGGFNFEVCHKIKEKRKGGSTIIPEIKITL